MAPPVESIGTAIWRSLKYSAKFLAVLLSPFVVAGALLFWLMFGRDPFNADDFDAQEWQRQSNFPEGMACGRGAMARDIEQRVLKPGMTHGDVVRLLGTPSSNTATPQEYRYLLGMCSSFADYDILHVYFDERGKFTQAAIIQH